MATSKPNRSDFVNFGKIDEIHNIVEMAQVMNSLGISSNGLTTLNEMRNRVKQTAIQPSWTVGDVSIDIRILQMI